MVFLYCGLKTTFFFSGSRNNRPRARLSINGTRERLLSKKFNIENRCSFVLRSRYPVHVLRHWKTKLQFLSRAIF